LSRFPEIRVTRDGGHVSRVEWASEYPEGAVLDLTGLRVLQVETVIEKNAPPQVKVTFAARLVEVDA